MNPDAKQVVTIAPDGSMSSLQRKDGLDLRQFGKVEIQRVSDIQWDSEVQKWYIKIIAGPKKGFIFPLFFKEYEEAVEIQIVFLDTLRKQGVF